MDRKNRADDGDLGQACDAFCQLPRRQDPGAHELNAWEVSWRSSSTSSCATAAGANSECPNGCLPLSRSPQTTQVRLNFTWWVNRKDAEGRTMHSVSETLS